MAPNKINRKGTKVEILNDSKNKLFKSLVKTDGETKIGSKSISNKGRKIEILNELKNKIKSQKITNK